MNKRINLGPMPTARVTLMTRREVTTPEERIESWEQAHDEDMLDECSRKEMACMHRLLCSRISKENRDTDSALLRRLETIMYDSGLFQYMNNPNNGDSDAN